MMDASERSTGPLVAWYINVCAFALEVERKLGSFELELAAMDPPTFSPGSRVGLHWRADEIRGVLDRFLAFVDKRMGIELNAQTFAPGAAERAGWSREDVMSDMIKDLDVRTILASLISSGKYDPKDVTQNVALAGEYAEELDRMRAAWRQKKSPRRGQ